MEAIDSSKDLYYHQRSRMSRSTESILKSFVLELSEAHTQGKPINRLHVIPRASSHQDESVSWNKSFENWGYDLLEKLSNVTQLLRA